MERRALLFLLVLAACGSRTGLFADELADDGQADASLSDAGRDARSSDAGVQPDALPAIDASVRDATVVLDCADAATLYVYLLSGDQELLRFDPTSLELKTIGVLACSTTFSANSMAVDHRGVAYAGYGHRDALGQLDDGRIFRVSTSTASCSPTPFVPQQGFIKFGMGFAGDTKGGETLFIADTETDPKGALASVDLTTFKLGYLGSFSPSLPRCELTGTGDGRLFGLCLDDPTGATLAEIDPKTAKVISADKLATGNIRDGFAFAHWGGSFWIFTGQDSSTITRYDPDKKTETIVGTSPSLIVGAGVSTCAPL